MATVLSRNLNDIKQVTAYMSECKSMGIAVLGPDVNESKVKFSTNKSGDVRFGLAAIKGVGEAASEAIVKERMENGPYKSIYDFMERVNYSVVNRKCLESIAYAGAFDSLIDFHRSRFFAEDQSKVVFIDMLVRYGQRIQQERQNAQQSLFGMAMDGGFEIQKPRVPNAEDWNNIVMLNKEKEVIGLYLSGHPLDRFDFIIKQMCKAELGDLSDLTLLNGKEMAVAGVVVSVTPLATKDGRRYTRFVLEDYNTQHEFTLWSKEYNQWGMLIELNNFLMIRGRVQPRPYREPEELEYKITSIQHLADVADSIKAIRLELEVHDVCSTLTDMLLDTVNRNSGKASLQITVTDAQADVKVRLISTGYHVAPTTEFIEFLQTNEINYSIIT
jgi:DNA polymerase-3 subunit alpha